MPKQLGYLSNQLTQEQVNNLYSEKHRTEKQLQTNVNECKAAIWWSENTLVDPRITLDYIRQNTYNDYLFTLRSIFDIAFHEHNDCVLSNGDSFIQLSPVDISIKEILYKYKYKKHYTSNTILESQELIDMGEQDFIKYLPLYVYEEIFQKWLSNNNTNCTEITFPLIHSKIYEHLNENIKMSILKECLSIISVKYMYINERYYDLFIESFGSLINRKIRKYKYYSIVKDSNNEDDIFIWKYNGKDRGSYFSSHNIVDLKNWVFHPFDSNYYDIFEMNRYKKNDMYNGYKRVASPYYQGASQYVNIHQATDLYLRGNIYEGSIIKVNFDFGESYKKGISDSIKKSIISKVLEREKNHEIIV